MKKIFLLLMILTIFTIPAYTQTKEEKKQQKEELAQKEYESTKKLIDSKMYVFNATWLTTQGGRRIDIRGNINQVEVKNNLTKASMQYFGVVTVSRFSSDGGVEFDSEIEDYKVKYIDKKKKIIISYSAKNKAEKYEVTITVFKNGSAFVDLYSSYKNNISYEGDLSPIINEQLEK
jgi:hypothetical protein